MIVCCLQLAKDRVTGELVAIKFMKVISSSLKIGFKRAAGIKIVAWKSVMQTRWHLYASDKNGMG